MFTLFVPSLSCFIVCGLGDRYERTDPHNGHSKYRYNEFFHLFLLLLYQIFYGLVRYRIL
ncbi:hypothetical protein [Leptolyngbya sp. 7M]|uniref:hypothetical protein n=1 Tax=Leptolyngbya sp. 7M TaxID=2812896 RepID=UPI001B8C43DA|nr:hypothetical protein [Leptolyngbya sp. 7M]QYO68930.1 hypothetical protein JVX88_12000 [Leptolyngbya sp. 7M]